MGAHDELPKTPCCKHRSREITDFVYDTRVSEIRTLRTTEYTTNCRNTHPRRARGSEALRAGAAGALAGRSSSSSSLRGPGVPGACPGPTRLGSQRPVYSDHVWKQGPGVVILKSLYKTQQQEFSINGVSGVLSLQFKLLGCGV